MVLLSPHAYVSLTFLRLLLHMVIMVPNAGVLLNFNNFS